MDNDNKVDGLEQAFKTVFSLSDDHYKLDEIGHVVISTVYWRVLWDRDAFDLKLLEKCEDSLNKFAEQNGIGITLLETTIVPRSLDYISQAVSISQ